MPVPSFIRELRAHVGTMELWLNGVTAVVLRDAPPHPGPDDEVLLVRRADNGRWAPVTGILDPGEEPAAGAVREVLEETGVCCRVESLAAVGTRGPITYPNGDVARYLDLTFRCAWVDGEPVVGDDESSEVAWVPLAGLPGLVPAMDPVHLGAIERACSPDPVTHFLRPAP